MNIDRATALAMAAALASSVLAACSGPGQPPAEPPETSAAADAGSAAIRVLNASPYAIAADAELSEFVRVTAEAALTENCVRCHRENLEGAPGVPNLVDFDWLWGVTGFESNNVEPVMAIHQTLLYGIRNRDCPEDQLSYGACADTRYSEMPGYVALGFTDQQIGDITEYVVDLSGGEADVEAASRAEEHWPLCTECHGEDGWGNVPYGGPALTDDIWLYGGDRDTIADVIRNGRLGQCPPWGEALDAATIKALAVHIWNRASGG